MNQESKNRNHLKFLNYNKKRHRELLEYSQFLKEEGKSLSHESHEKFLELSKYSSLLDAQLDWEARDYYLELLDQVMKKKLPLVSFFLNCINKVNKSNFIT